MTVGYSATPLVSKLSFKAAMRTHYVNAPEHFPALVGTLPDVKVCAIDVTWSGLKLVIRVERR